MEAAFEEGKNTIEYQGKTYRRNTYVKAILLMGIDRAETLQETKVAGSGGQADGIFLVAWDTARDKARLLLIPRDTMTPITLTDLSGNVLGQDIQHLTLAYAYGDGRKKSCLYMKEAVTNLLEGLEIDGYMAVSMEALPVLNDAVGGVSVTIEDEGLAAANGDFILGDTILLNGKQAEAYIRYRDIGKAQSALERMERQKSYIQGFVQAARDKARQEEGFIARTMDEAQDYMVTDMEKGRYIDMALTFLGGSQSWGREDMLTLPGTPVETNLYDEFHPDKEKMMPMILELFYREE
ncbi:LCP family protein [Lacrimispora sp. 210928-DFI.3.58]|nr:LCP family protein [Lacrimispora sp. 210928-DFI.3.58]MCB7320739.1 LCP family protein [Lacrimispora sp. 210928-DFI.3.58]